MVELNLQEEKQVQSCTSLVPKPSPAAQSLKHLTLKGRRGQSPVRDLKIAHNKINVVGMDLETRLVIYHQACM